MSLAGVALETLHPGFPILAPPWRFKQLNSQPHYSQTLPEMQQLGPMSQPEPAFNKFYKRATCLQEFEEHWTRGVGKPAEKRPVDASSAWFLVQSCPTTWTVPWQKNPHLPFLATQLLLSFSTRAASLALTNREEIIYLVSFSHQIERPTMKTFEESIKTSPKGTTIFYFWSGRTLWQVCLLFSNPDVRKQSLSFQIWLKLTQQMTQFWSFV